MEYEEQKIFYIYADDGWIVRYFIADFYIPEKELIIEVDGKFHNEQKKKDTEIGIEPKKTVMPFYTTKTLEKSTGNPTIDSYRWLIL